MKVDGKNMKIEHKILIDSSELQNRVLECIFSDEVDKFFSATVFASNPESQACRQAMIHGMVIASMMACQCDHVLVKKEIEE